MNIIQEVQNDNCVCGVYTEWQHWKRDSLLRDSNNNYTHINVHIVLGWVLEADGEWEFSLKWFLGGLGGALLGGLEKQSKNVGSSWSHEEVLI